MGLFASAFWKGLLTDSEILFVDKKENMKAFHSVSSYIVKRGK